MQANYFDNMIFGTILNGQGSVIAVDAKHRAKLRTLLAEVARSLSWCLCSWRALSIKRMPATMAPAMATCSTRRHQRHQRWMPGVVVVPGTVGVC